MPSSVPYSFPGQLHDSIEVSDGDASKPVILFLHGTGGNASDMSDPTANWSFNYNFTSPLPADRDEGWSLYPGVGVWSFTLDPKKKVTNWADVLQGQQFRTATYSQVQSTGLLQAPVAELQMVFQALSEALPDAQFVLLAHSRGGLLARKFLKDNPTVAARIPFLITLHAPHEGSHLANVADTLNSTITTLTQTFGSIVTTALGWLEVMVNEPAFQELAVGGPFLTDLETNEVALPGVQYFSFGGVSVELTRVVSWVYDLGSAIPQWHWPPFHHIITAIETPGISPVANHVPPITPEITEGQGDLLTEDSNCRFSFKGAVHQSNSINHAEALWDPNLQAQVLQILGLDVAVGPAAGGGTGFWQ